jgi:membrane protein DedA with SNARE-associated domain
MIQIQSYAIALIAVAAVLVAMAIFYCFCRWSENKRKIHILLNEAKVDEETDDDGT